MFCGARSSTTTTILLTMSLLTMGIAWLTTLN